MARPSNTLERRAQIVDGLLTVMASEGFERASIAAIGRAADLTPGLLHYHFANKQEILVELVERLVARVKQRFASRLARAGTHPRERLFAFIDAHLAKGPDADERAVAAWVVVAAEALRQDEVRAIYSDAIEEALFVLRDLFEALLRAEKRTTRNAGALAATVMAAIEGAYQLSAAAPEVMPKGYAAPALRRMIDGMIEGEQRRRTR